MRIERPSLRTFTGIAIKVFSRTLRIGYIVALVFVSLVFLLFVIEDPIHYPGHAHERVRIARFNQRAGILFGAWSFCLTGVLVTCPPDSKTSCRSTP